MLRSTLVLALALIAGACASPNPYYDAARRHHRPHGFNNNYVDNRLIGEGFLRWQLERAQSRLPADRAERVPRVSPNLAYLQANRDDLTITWIGHATALWQVSGLNILTDPHFTERASPVSFAGPRRQTPPAISLNDLPRIDAVLISHNHYDHLDRDTVRALAAQSGGPPLFVVPLGLDRWFSSEGISTVKALDWWESVHLGSTRIHLVPAQHWSARSPFDRHETLWGGFVVSGQGKQLYYAGDTGYSQDFRDIQARFGNMDFAQLPVGCYEPRWFMGNQHVDPPEAIRIHRDVGARISMGVHWGTFRLCDDPVDAPLDLLPPALAAAGVAPGEFILPALGQTLVLQRARAYAAGGGLEP